MSLRTSRRDFLKTSAAGLALPLAAPSLLSARSPNEVVRVAGIGVGGKGWTDVNGAAKHAEVIAYCDVETKGTRRGGFGNAAKTWPDAKGYTDYRKLLDAHAKDLDGITVSTPDHMHAPITLAAMERGLAVYTQKPLTRTIHEARTLTQAAAKAKVSTQMGNQNHSGSGYRSVVEIVRSGLVGKIKTAHTWSNRPIWPQGIERPAGSDPVPESLDWDLWLGVANDRPYKANVYAPFKWRGWYDFGAGALGDMGCHIIDPVVWALELGPPTGVSYEGPEPMPETFPEWEVLTYRFPGTEHTTGDELVMTWSDGGKLPSTEGSHVPADVKLPANGVMLVGEKGTVLCQHVRSPQVYPLEKFPEKDLPKVDGLDHYGVWINGIRAGEEPNSGFSYSGPLTETVLLGVVASRVEADELLWDAENLRFTNSEAANAFVKEEYRTGW